MLESSEYVLAWLAYLLSAVGVLAVWWRVTRFIPWMPLKQLLRVLVAAPMLIPAPVAEGALEWAPALFVLLFDITLVKEGDPLRGLAFVLYAQFIGLLVLVADGLIRYWWSKRSPSKAEPVTESAA
ncbi:MAG: hypothetical protein MI808_10815 [Pseudomonadales bacterium]|nr:hypothetical protein [Pseudomonadales bacterium]